MEWRNLQSAVERAAIERLGQRTKAWKRNKTKLWNHEIEKTVGDKKQVYLRS